MKKLKKILFLLTAISLFAVAYSDAQIVVKARLFHHGRVVRPERPSERHVWVDGEWVPQGHTYVERPGYWAEPPHPGGVWVAGRWTHRPGGYVWVGGHWR